MSLDPARLTRELVDEYTSYLRSRFFFKDERLQRQFGELLENERRLYSGPYLELTPPFRPGSTPRQLVERGVFQPEILRIAAGTLHPDRPLYLHQQRAIEKIQSGRNVVVATGTGSGKTETYLLPIVDHILTAKRGSRAVPGIHALLVYPMNALANDQLKRLRELLRATPEITFGRYTGETARARDMGLNRFRETWPREPVLPNELKSREEMWETPPNILVTNFAMLEYLLVRPQDRSFFEPGSAEILRFLVLDEVHTYDGAKGTEIAMLLRRLKERAGFRGQGILRCVGTSATLGGRGDLPDIAGFASQLFDEPFVCEANGEVRDVLEAERTAYRRPSRIWCPADDRFYSDVADTFLAATVREDAVARLLSEPSYEVPAEVRDAVTSALRTETEGTRAEMGQAVRKDDDWGWGSREPADRSPRTLSVHVTRALFELLHGEERLNRLREVCGQGPRSLRDVEREIFPGARGMEGRDAILALVSAGGRATASLEEAPLLRARYHLFLRALEGGFVCFKEHGPEGEPRLFLERRVTCEEHQDSRTFEVGSCRRCGEPMLVGSVQREPGGLNSVTSEDPTQDQLLEDDKRRRIVLAFGTTAPTAANEDEVDSDDDAAPALSRLRICRTCGVYGERAEDWTCLCDAGGEPLDVVKVPTDRGDIKLCPSCGSRSRQRDVLQTLYTGPDEPVAELATTIYQTVNRDYAAGRDAKRKLLTFSDSRQDAAYFAPYLEGVYRGALRRHVILNLLQNDTAPLPLADLTTRLTGFIEDRGWMGPDATPGHLEAEAWRWTMAELLHGNRTRRALEELGLVDFELRRYPDIPVPPALLRRWQMDEGEAWILVQVLLDSIRGAYVFRLPEGIRSDDPVFAPARADRSVALRRADNDRRTLSWIPQLAHLSNSRLDYLTRLAEVRGLSLSRGDLAEFLQGMFSGISRTRTALSSIATSIAPTTRVGE